jgi:hypothetical protein
MWSRHFPHKVRLFFYTVLVFGAFAGSCLAPETPREPNARERGLLAESYLREKLPHWQGRLKLQDWSISIVMTHPTALRQRTLGNIRWDAKSKTAVIKVLDASDYHMPFRATLKDMEFTIVHELIHLELASLPRSEASRSEEEHAINHLADALLQHCN